MLYCPFEPMLRIGAPSTSTRVSALALLMVKVPAVVLLLETVPLPATLATCWLKPFRSKVPRA